MLSLNNQKVPSLAGTSNDTGTVRKAKRKSLDERGADSEDQMSSKNKTTEMNGSGEASTNRTTKFKSSQGKESSETKINLDRGELLKLLSVFEGELQARDEVIAILKSECSNNSEGRYGLASQPLKALQRDATSFDMQHHNDATDDDHEDIAAHTKDQLKKIIQQQKDSHKRLKQLFLASQDKNQRIMVELNMEKRKQQEYMIKSDDFVNLIEEDRERLKQMLQHEKATHERKERELTWKIKESSEELTKMKSLSIELIEERQKQLQSFAEQRQLTASLQSALEDMKVKIKQVEIETSNEREHANQLENDLEEQSNRHIQEIEELGEQLRQEQENNKQYQEQTSAMKKRIKHLQMMDKSLRKTDDQLLRIQEKLTQQSSDQLLDEIESLRSTMSEMEDAEKVYAQAQEECRELRESLESEVALTRNLRSEVERLRKSHKNQIEMERCVEESTFRFDEIQNQFDAERKKSEKLKLKFDEFAEQLKRFVETEEMLESTQLQLQQSLDLVEEMKNDRGQLEMQLEQAVEKCAQHKEELEEEKLKVANAKQKHINESRTNLRLKEEMSAISRRHDDESKALKEHVDSLTAALSAKESEAENEQDEDKLHLRRQISALQSRLETSEKKNQELEKKKQEMENDAELAKNRLVQSAGKLKELVTSGFNEQLAIVKCDEYAQKIKELEAENERLRSAASSHKPAINGSGIYKMASSSGYGRTSSSDQLMSKHRGVTMSDGEDATKVDDNGAPLRPPTKQSIRHAALRKTSPSPNKNNSSSSQGGATVTRTSSLKSMRNVRACVFNRALSGNRAPTPDLIEGRPPSRAGRDRGAKVTASKSDAQPRSRSIVRSKKKSESASTPTPPPSAGGATSKPPASTSKRSKSKTRNKSLTRVANLIKPSSSSSSADANQSKSKSSGSEKTTASDKKTKQTKTTTGIPKLRSTTPTLLPASKKTTGRSTTKK